MAARRYIATPGSSPLAHYGLPHPNTGYAGYQDYGAYTSSPAYEYPLFQDVKPRVAGMAGSRLDSDTFTLNPEASRLSAQERRHLLASRLAFTLFDSIWRAPNPSLPSAANSLAPFLHALLVDTATPLESVLAALFYIEKLRKAHPTAKGKDGFERSVVTVGLLLAAKFWSEDSGAPKDEGSDIGLLLDEEDDDPHCDCRICAARHRSLLESLAPVPFLGSDDGPRFSARTPTPYRLSTPEPRHSYDSSRASVWKMAAQASPVEPWQPGRRSNTFWAKHAAIPLSDLTTMESEFLSGLGWRLCIAREEFFDFLDRAEAVLRSSTMRSDPRTGRKVLGLVRGVRERCLAEMQRESPVLAPKALRVAAGPRRVDMWTERSATPESVSSDGTMC